MIKASLPAQVMFIFSSSRHVGKRITAGFRRQRWPCAPSHPCAPSRTISMSWSETDYISIRKDEHGRNIYSLLLSDRLIALLGKLGIPTHDPRITAEEPHEKFSHDIRVNKKQDITPLSPLPSPAAISPLQSSRRTGFPSSAPTTQRVQGRGDFSSLSRTNATPHAPRVLHRPAVSHEFEQLWLAWPQTATWDMPRNRQLALRVFRRMERAGQLPPIENLLATVELYKRTDSRWLNGYPPELSNWLHSRQFEKAPLMRRPKKTFFGKLVPAEPVLTPEERRQAEVYRARIEELQKRFNQPTVSASPTPSHDADALIALWPEPERQRVPVTTYLNYLSGKGKRLDLARSGFPCPRLPVWNFVTHESCRLAAQLPSLRRLTPKETSP